MQLDFVQQGGRLYFSVEAPFLRGKMHGEISL